MANQTKETRSNLLPFDDKGVSLENRSKEDLATMVRNLVGSGKRAEYIRPEKPTIIRITIDIREDLIDSWGALIINKFTLLADSGEVVVTGDDISLPGFIGQGKDADDILFNLQTERIPYVKSKKGKSSPTSKSGKRRSN